jgi:hypothetical protein
VFAKYRIAKGATVIQAGQQAGGCGGTGDLAADEDAPQLAKSIEPMDDGIKAREDA